MSDENRCGAPTEDDGGPCPTPIALCSECGRCRSHCRYDPECDYDADEVRASRAKGAKRKAEKARDDKIRTVPDGDAPPPPESARDAMEWGSWTVWAVATGKIDARTAHEIGYNIRAFLKTRETAQLEEEFEEFREEVRERLADQGRNDLEVMD